MISLIHLLEHLGLPAGAAIAIIMAARKMLKGAFSRPGGTSGPGGRRSQRRSRGYR
jgi:hypothetical protein